MQHDMKSRIMDKSVMSLDPGCGNSSPTHLLTWVAPNKMTGEWFIRVAELVDTPNTQIHALSSTEKEIHVISTGSLDIKGYAWLTSKCDEGPWCQSEYMWLELIRRFVLHRSLNLSSWRLIRIIEMTQVQSEAFQPARTVFYSGLLESSQQFFFEASKKNLVSHQLKLKQWRLLSFYPHF